LRGERLGGDFAEGGHAQTDCLVTAGGGDFELGELVAGGSEADFESFGLTCPAFAFGFADPGDQVVADAGQPGLLGWVNPQQGAPDAPLTELNTMFQQFMAGFRLSALTCPRDRIG
jgi:hypothetical protein